MYQRSAAHHARLDGHIQSGANESIVADVIGCCPQGEHLGVSAWIPSPNWLIKPFTNDFSIQNDKASNGHFA